MNLARVHYPQWAYNLMPYLYALSGLALMLAVQGVAAYATGIVLMAVGALVWTWRNRYRRAFARSKGYIEALDWSDLDGPVSGLVQISWRSCYECGHPVLDAQHRRLFGMSNEFCAAVLAGARRPELLGLLDKFIIEIDQHFATEEALLAATKQPISPEHREQHAALLAKAVMLRERFDRDAGAVREIVDFLVFEVVMDHIANEELDFPGVTKKAPRNADSVKAAKLEMQFKLAREAALQPAPKSRHTMIYRENDKAIESDWTRHVLDRESGTPAK